MTKVEDFGKHLFTILANKLIHEETPGPSEEKFDISENKPDILEKNLCSAEENLKYSDSNDDISRSVLMLSYVYRSAFRERFLGVRSILMRAEGNPMIYARCFAEASHEKYSPLKFLIVCSFISEIFLFKLLVLKKKHRYVQQTTEALNDVFQCIFEKDFPQNGWTDIENEASKIAKGFQFLEPFMNNETSNITASQVADAIITDNYESENEHQQADVVMAGTPSQEMVSVNIPSVSSSQILVHIPAIEVPILSPDGLPTNQTNYLAHYENLVYTPVFPISFGTVDEDEQLLYLLRDPGDQTEAVTFQNQSSGTEPSFQKVVEIAKASNTESHAQENLTARISEDKPELSFQTVKPTEGGAIEPCAADNAIISKQEIIYDEDQFWSDFLSSGSEDESGPSFQTVKETEYLESESCIADNAIISEQELIDAEKQFWKNCLYLSSKIEPIGDTIKGYFQGLKENNDSISETLSKEKDPESETFSKEENVNDPESEKFSKESYDPDSKAFSKEENTLASGNAVNVPENQSQTFCQR